MVIQGGNVKKAVNLQNVVNTQMIEDYITEKRLTKASFCRLCKIGTQTLDRMLSGKNFKINALFKVARALNVQVHKLLSK